MTQVVEGRLQSGDMVLVEIVGEIGDRPMSEEVDALMKQLAAALVEGLTEREAMCRADEAAITEAAAVVAKDREAVTAREKAVAKREADADIRDVQAHARDRAAEAREEAWNADRKVIAALATKGD